MKLKIKFKEKGYSFLNMNLVIVKKVRHSLRETSEHHQAGADKDADVDVFKGLFLLRKGSCQHLKEQMSRSDLIS